MFNQIDLYKGIQFIICISVLVILLAVGSYSQTKTAFEENFPTNKVICRQTDLIEQRVFWAYGGAYLAQGIESPGKCVMNKKETKEFQEKLEAENKLKKIDGIGGFQLQIAAADALNKVLQELALYYKKRKVSFSPMYLPRECNPDKNKNPLGCDEKRIFNKDWAKRNYDDVLNNWNGRLKKDELKITSEERVGEKIQNALDTISGIEYSAAIPGASQHLLLTAIDVNTKFCKPASKCEELLINHGWFRTVDKDPNHFTYLGFKEEDLEHLGFAKKVIGETNNAYIYHIPKKN